HAMEMDNPGTVEFRNVTFGYPGAEAPVLNDVSFIARRGETTAIIGSTGSGKSTLLNLIPRLYAAGAGEVLVGGVPVTELTRKQRSGAVATVPQRPYLFSGTIASNLRFGAENATEDDLWAALDVAQAHEFVTAREDGLDG